MKKLLLLLAAVVCISTTASAQDKGDWAIMPRINIYTAWDADTVFGIGAAARYNVLDQLRLEPALTLLCHDGCSIDLLQFLCVSIMYFKPAVISHRSATA